MTPDTSTRVAPAVCLALALLLVVSAWAADVVIVEDWTKPKLGAKGIPDGFTVEENDGHRVLHLRSEGDSSMITKELDGTVNLKSTPVLEWRWMAVTLPKGADARSRQTDDQAAQLYVVWPRFPQEFRSRIIGYIWDTQAPEGLVVKSQKALTVTYIVVRSGPAELGKWLTERRNVVEDYKKLYGEPPDKPGALSIAIDSDDTNSSAESFFGPIVFTKP